MSRSAATIRFIKHLVTDLGIALPVTLAVSGLSHADEASGPAREIYRTFGDAVVAIKIVTRDRMIVSGREMDKGEQRFETTAIVADSSGIAVLSLFETDPLGGYSPDFGAGEDDPDMSFESEITDVRMLMSDGTEIPAKVVLRDRDLDLAFIRPIPKTKRRFTYIDFSRDDTLDVLEQAVLLGRLGSIAGRAPSVALTRIQAVVMKPRLLYIPEPTAVIGGLARPAFSLQGKIAGILLMRTTTSKGTPQRRMPVILPAEEIREAMQQIPAQRDRK